MKKTRTCIHCDTTFPDIDGKVFANHVRWCDSNTTNGDAGRTNISKALIERSLNIVGELVQCEVTCAKCSKKFMVTKREFKPFKERYFCSLSCANTHVISDEQKEKIRQWSHANRKPSYVEKQCEFCNKTMILHAGHGKRFCSCSCAMKHRQKPKSDYYKYRCACQFSFSLKDYPGEFDFSLIEKYGWYSAANRGNNSTGVSRDHAVSIAYGFANNIDPAIIKHPANCVLMQQTKNASKHTTCSMTLEELMQRIEVWDTKFAPLF